MAKSNAHRFGQIIGDVLELAITPTLQDFTTKQNLYLDSKGKRGTRKGVLVTWKDVAGNKHNLDFVIEKDGGNDKVGKPVAFIETAWRRYTKHSRNKAQEIQGAILPLVQLHSRSSPFMGAILAGEFTTGAITQLESHKFTVLNFSYEDVVEAFKFVGIDASSEENTAEEIFKQKVDAWEALSQDEKLKVGETLVARKPDEVKKFVESLKRAVARQVVAVHIIPLHGEMISWNSVLDAIEFIRNYEERSERPIFRYEIEIQYENGSEITGSLVDKQEAIEFLSSYLSAPAFPAD